MRIKQRTLPLAGLAAVCLVACAAGPADAFDVPPFKGNDTGGIIAWTLAGQTDARQLAVDHCARYGKLVKPLAAQRTYGGYISFACIWPRQGRVQLVSRVTEWTPAAVRQPVERRSPASSKPLTAQGSPALIQRLPPG